MEMKKLLNRSIFLLFLVILSCTPIDESNPKTNDTGLLENSSDFNGSFPAPSKITYLDNGVSTEVTAFPGQIIVFFNMPISETNASQIINANGGTIIAKIPAIGYYLVSSSTDKVSAIISTLQSNSKVDFVSPHITGSLSSGVVILDGCSISHGANVQAALQDNGGTFNDCRDIVTTGTDVGASKIIKEILTEGNRNKTGTTLINLSASGGLRFIDWATQTPAIKAQAQKEWFLFMRTALLTIAALPSEYRENLAITIASGNANMPITSLMTLLRSNPRIASVLNKNVLVVSTTLMPGNYSTTDPDVVIRDNYEAANGTSFAAPAAMAILQNIMKLTGADVKVALKSVKQAVATNANHKLLQSEAIDKANAILAAQKVDPPSSYNITGISFKSIGATTSAVITPIVAGISVSYTVSGTDGYYDSGTLQTNSSGIVTFTIPPGGSGVRDAISVTAILSGVTTKMNYTW
jgi:hypothetical protein